VLDFKEKSIQVIRKTPEAYIEAGWDVHYVVARDGFKKMGLKSIDLTCLFNR